MHSAVHLCNIISITLLYVHAQFICIIQEHTIQRGKGGQNEFFPEKCSEILSTAAEMQHLLAAALLASVFFQVSASASCSY